MNTSCYARRQLNPFGGVLQVIEQEQARALSSNGRLWHVQVLAERPEHTWRSANSAPLSQYFNWARWNEAQGLHKINANPILDIGAMSQAASQLSEELRHRLPGLPFPLQDRYEYWACDAHGEPVALLSSCCQREQAEVIATPQWRACASDQAGFVSLHLVDAGIPADAPDHPRAHADYLEKQVMQRIAAGDWFLRSDKGNGVRLEDGGKLEASRFPPLGIREDWPSADIAAAFSDYITWMAPLLLTLPGLGKQRRTELEILAMKQAPLVAGLYRLYPNIIQRELIQQARVETRLRHANI